MTEHTRNNGYKRNFSFFNAPISKSHIFYNSQQDCSESVNINQIYITRSKGHILFRDFITKSNHSISFAQKSHVGSINDLSKFFHHHFDMAHNVLQNNNSFLSRHLTTLQSQNKTMKILKTRHKLFNNSIRLPLHPRK